MQRLKDIVYKAKPVAGAAPISFTKKSFDPSTLIEPGRYFPESMHHIAATKLKYEFAYIWTVVPGFEVRLIYVCRDSNAVTLAKQFVYWAKWMGAVLNQIKPLSVPRKLTITLLDIDIPKRVRWTDIPTPENVNGGFTWGDQIYVYRREEMCKVLIHEMVHYWDFQLTGAADKEAEARRIFGVADLNFNEGYVDSLAVLLYTALMSADHNRDFNKTWKRQREHVMYQALCVSMNYLAIAQQKSSTQLATIQEKTNTMSYYVVKAAIYCAGTRYWATLDKYQYNLGSSTAATRQFYDILLDQINNTKSAFWKRMKEVHASRGVCKDGDSMRMTAM